jgi:putative phage-type endonuclease
MNEKINYLLQTYGIDDQRTQGWYDKRRQRITASECWKAFNNATKSSRFELIMSKLVEPVKTGMNNSRALIWGTRFEPIAKEIYCFVEKIRIEDLTCVPHPQYDFLGASPDGLIISDDFKNGRLVEFKCPISREFDDNSAVPENYYHQMQLQMECTDLSECMYIEMQFSKINYTEWENTFCEFKSCFAVNLKTQEVVYKKIDNKQSLSEWNNSFIDDVMDWEIIYWTLKKWRHILIEKDKEWFPTYLPQMKQTWEEIMNYKERSTFPTLLRNNTILEL